MPREAVNHPQHYNEHPSGIECIDIVEHMGFNLGNAIKYIWRADLKADALEDLRKAAWYLQREIEKRTKEQVTAAAPIAGPVATFDSTWTKWGGGTRPVGPLMIVEVKYRNGGSSGVRESHTLDWVHRGFEHDIVAYRVPLLRD